MAELFYPGETYTQAEVNARLEGDLPDPVTLRRDLVDFIFSAVPATAPATGARNQCEKLTGQRGRRTRRVCGFPMTVKKRRSELLWIPPFLPQSIRLAGCATPASFGGYARPGHQRVRRGVLPAPPDPAAMEEDLWRSRRKFSLGCIVDFRTTAEWSNQPDRSVPGAAHYHPLVVDESDPNGSIARDTAQFQGGDRPPGPSRLGWASGRYNTNIYVDMPLSPGA